MLVHFHGFLSKHVLAFWAPLEPFRIHSVRSGSEADTAGLLVLLTFGEVSRDYEGYADYRARKEK